MNFKMSATLAAGLCLLRGKLPCFVAGTLSHHAAAFAQHRPGTPPCRCRHSDGILERSRRRARRRATRYAKLRMIAEGGEERDVATAPTTEAGPATATRYTIDDSVCPPTDPERLRDIVEKHVYSLPSFWRSKPVAGHTRRAFDECLDWIRASNTREGGERVKVVLDSGCGTGRSSLVLGRRHPDCLVIGIDQSVARLSRNRAYPRPLDGSDGGDGNVMLARAELGDFWRCMIGSDEWRGLCEVRRHYLLYPNPYPKASRLKSRFYCSSSFPYLMMTLDMVGGGGGGGAAGGERLTVRSNWRGYLDEFRDAAGVYGETGADLGRWLSRVEAGGGDGWRPGGAVSPGRTGRLRAVGPSRLGRGDVEPITNFEAKYVEVGEPINELSFHSASVREDEVR